MLPQLSWFMKPQQRAIKTEEVRQAKKLKKLAKHLERLQHKDTEKERRNLAKRLKALAKQMKRGRLSKAEALKRYRQLTKEAEALQRKLAQANTLKQKLTTQALENLREALEPQQTGVSTAQGVRSALQHLIRKLRGGQLTPAERRRLAAVLNRAAEALKKAGSPAAANALGQALSSLEGALSELDAGALSDEALAELLDGRMDLALADDICPSCGNPAALCTCDNCEYG